MSSLAVWTLALLLAYLLGSIPTGYLLVRAFRDQDIRTTGSGNIGATNVARSGAQGLGVVTLVCDALKGFVAVALARFLAAHHVATPQAYDLVALAGLFVILGHVFPVWLGFRGGKGVATALGVFLALSPLLALATVILFAAVFAWTRYVSLASIVAGAAFAVLAIVFDNKHRVIVDLVYLAIPLLVIVKHSGNIQRLLAHTEPKFGAKQTA